MKKIISLFLIFAITLVSVVSFPQTTSAYPKNQISKLTTDYKSVHIYISDDTNSWDRIIVYRSTKKSSGFKKIRIVYTQPASADKPLYTDTKLKFNKVYYYKLKTFYPSCAKVSKVKSVRTALKSTKGAYYVQAKNGYDQIYWSKITGATGYRIYRAATTKEKYKLVKTVGNKVKYNFKRPVKGQTYYYKICAYKKVGKKIVCGPSAKITLKK